MTRTIHLLLFLLFLWSFSIVLNLIYHLHDHDIPSEIFTCYFITTPVHLSPSVRRDIDLFISTQVMFSSWHFVPQWLYSCYLMRILCLSVELPSCVQRSRRKSRQCGLLKALCQALISLLLMISGNMHINSGPNPALNYMSF